MMQIQKFSRLFVAQITCIAFFLSPFTSISVSATSSSNESDFLHGFYVEHVTKEINGTGVDIGNAENTDYGITTGNYIYNKTGVTTQDIIDYVSNQYSNATGYVVETASDYADKVKNVLNRTIDGTLSAGYKAEKALRTVVDSAGNVYYNVSSSDYWNGIYNRWFNNSGYKVQYNEEQNGVKVQYDEFNAVIININYGDKNYGWTYNASTDSVASELLKYPNEFCLSYGSTTNKSYIIPLFSITLQTSYGTTTVYKPLTYLHSESVSMENDGGLIIKKIEPRSDKIYVNFGPAEYSTNYLYTIDLKSSFTYQDTSNNVTYVPQPSQVGFIQYPLGSKTPIYTDPSLNPSDWTINDNGTVTIDGNDYPALIDEKEIDDNGWLDMLNLLDGEDSREMSLKDPWGNPWDTQDDGSALGGFFGNLVKDIQKMFKGIGDKIKEIFQKPIDVLSDLVDKIKTALTEFFTFSPDDLNVDVSFDFDILESIWNAFLQQLGLA